MVYYNPPSQQPVAPAPNFTVEQAALERRERLLQALAQQQGPQVPLQHYGPLNALADAVRGGLGIYGADKLGTQKADLAGRIVQDRSQGMTKVAEALAKGDSAALTPFVGSQHADVSKAALEGVTTLNKPKTTPAELQEYELWEKQGGKGGYAGFLRYKASLTAGAGKDSYKLLTPEEVKAAGLPEGTVAQRSSTGKVEILKNVSDTATARKEGANTLDTLVATLNSYYDELEQGGGITSTENGTLENVGASIASSGVGQAVGRAVGTTNQSARNMIAQQRPLLLQAIKNATGMTAKQMDSNVELKLYLAAATDPQLDVQANRAALAKLLELYGSPQAGAAGPMEFASEADAEAAAAAGKLKAGDKIKVGGRSATWQ